MQKAIAEAKANFLQGLPVKEGVVRKEILNSWERSRKFGVIPGKPDKAVISQEELNKRIAARQTFYDIAVPLMENLSAFTAGAGFLTILCDEEGYILRLLADPEIKARSMEDGLVQGCNRSERRFGTNGIGTPLETGRPIQVFGQEHYYDVRVNWVCSGAPIFDPQDKIVGSLCFIGTNDKVSSHTLGMAAAVAEAISRQLKMKGAYDIIDTIRNQMNVMIEYMPSGLLLLDNNLMVKQANSLAARLLELNRSDLDGQSFLDLFGNITISREQLATGFNDKQITVHRRGRVMNLSVSLITTPSGTYVATCERVETLHKKINRIIGSEARFTFDDVIGKSQALKSVVNMARTAAGTNSNIFLMGESGTGKELFAQAIHNASSRRDGPFVAINCGALPKSLVQSELFGYEGGSFTGAKREGSAGKFELADGGTIFLDEIGDMPFDAQVSLLRVLQNREIVRIGSDKTRKIDVRVIAATNQNLLAAIEDQTFRSDLYYRLNVFTVQLPPLRERTEDITVLAEFFLRKYSEYATGSILGFREDAYKLMEGYHWPGNIRELENAVERAINIVKNGWIGADSLPFFQGIANRGSQPNRPAAVADSGSYSIRNTERMQIREALRAADGNVTKAAEMLEISRRTIYRKMEKYGISTAGGQS